MATTPVHPESAQATGRPTPWAAVLSMENTAEDIGALAALIFSLATAEDLQPAHSNALRALGMLASHMADNAKAEEERFTEAFRHTKLVAVATPIQSQN